MQTGHREQVIGGFGNRMPAQSKRSPYFQCACGKTDKLHLFRERQHHWHSRTKCQVCHYKELDIKSSKEEIIHRNCGKRIEECTCSDATVKIVKDKK